jgi:sec-independent protein translocase protein TatA
MQDDDKVADKPAEPSKSIEHTAAPTAARSDVGSKAV